MGQLIALINGVWLELTVFLIIAVIILEAIGGQLHRD